MNAPSTILDLHAQIHALKEEVATLEGANQDLEEELQNALRNIDYLDARLQLERTGRSLRRAA